MAAFEDFIPIGKKFVSPGRTISEGDFSLLVNLTWSTFPFHTDREYMKETQFEERILPGTCTLACTSGLATQIRGLREVFMQDGFRIVAMLGLERIRFTAPVKPGDTLTVHVEITGIRPTRKNPKRGIAETHFTAVNQEEQEVISYTLVDLVELTD